MTDTAIDSGTHPGALVARTDSGTHGASPAVDGKAGTGTDAGAGPVPPVIFEGGRADTGSIDTGTNGPCPAPPASSAIDFSFEAIPRDSAEYDGAVAVSRATDAASILELVGTDDTRVGLKGVLPDSTIGTSLWGQFEVSDTHPNPYADVFSYHLSVRSSHDGPILAEAALEYVGIQSFLGVKVETRQVCQTASSFGACGTARYYSLTIHGDDDVTVMLGAHATVIIGGVAYDVWLTDASEEDVSGCNVQDYARHPGLSVAARISRYEDAFRDR